MIWCDWYKKETVILFGCPCFILVPGNIYFGVVIGGLCHAGSSSTLWWAQNTIEQRLCLHLWGKPFSGVWSILSSIPRRFFLVPSVKIRRTGTRWENGSHISGKKGPRTCWQRQLFLLGDSFPFICYSSLTGTFIEDTHTHQHHHYLIIIIIVAVIAAKLEFNIQGQNKVENLQLPS